MEIFEYSLLPTRHHTRFWEFFLMNKIGSSHKNLNEVMEVKVEITERLVNSGKNFALYSRGNAS